MTKIDIISGFLGAGKTTLLRMIAGILTPTNGNILYDDVDISTSALKIKNEIAYLSGNTKSKKKKNS